MADVLLCISDFELGTKISDALTQSDLSVQFVGATDPWDWQVPLHSNVAILDLDNVRFSSVLFISSLKSRYQGLILIGFMKRIHKETHDKLKAAGCDFIFPRSSIVKNIPSLIKNL